jgi:hypothetical protein
MLPEWAKQDLGTNIGAGQVFSFHRLVHLAAFGCTSLLLIALARTRKQRIAALALVIATGFGIEFLEDYIYHCGLEVWDVRDDTVAALLGYMFSRLRPVHASEAPSATAGDSGFVPAS